MALTDEQLERYSRHIVLKGLGAKGQKRLLAGSVLIVGAGGLGSPAALYLAAAGVGRLGIADFDTVSLSNLQRQILHTTQRVGVPKAQSAAETLRALNPDVDITIHQVMVDASNIMDIVEPYDFIIDAADNFATKFLINDACVLAEKPFCHAGVLRFSGQLMTYVPDEGPCYRCAFKSPPDTDDIPTCSSEGILGAVAGVMGSLQAVEAVKYLAGIGELMVGKLLMYDALFGDFSIIELSGREPDCAVCGEHPTISVVSDSGRIACAPGA